MSFKDLGLSSEVLDALTDSGYATPTPIQEKAIPYVLMGRDVLGCAQTGTGKTAGFVLPMIDVLAEGRAKARMPRSLILAPTRELAHQVGESFERYGKYHKLSKALLIGGSSMAEQEQKLDRGVDVLIATPGRLIDLFERGKVLLADVKILVIDEADRMLDMGFIPDVERIVGLLPTIRQTLFFSATMPKEIRRLADRFLMNPKEVSVAPPASPADTVEQGLVRVPGPDKRKALNQLLGAEDVESALIFCNRKRDVSALNKALQKQELASGELHGDMAQPVRMETLERFKNGELKILVCSDVAARGLDMPKVSHVFNYDVPGHPEDYVHRIGRTGRAGRSGKAFMLATPADGKALANIEKTMNKAIPAVALDKVRILKPEEVEGEYAPNAVVEAPTGAAAPAAGGEDTAAQADPSGDGKAASKGARRRRGGRGKRRSNDNQPAAANQDAPADAQAQHQAADRASSDRQDADRQDPDPGDADRQTAGHQSGETAGPEPAATAAQASGSGRLNKAAAETARQARDGSGQAAPRKRSGEAKASGKSGASASDKGQSKSKNRNKGKGEASDQASNGRQSKPFGDHTPAFLLKPVPQSATA
jgi:superfamily II DNA/RNA helicase